MDGQTTDCISFDFLSIAMMALTQYYILLRNGCCLLACYLRFQGSSFFHGSSAHSPTSRPNILPAFLSFFLFIPANLPIRTLPLRTRTFQPLSATVPPAHHSPRYSEYVLLQAVSSCSVLRYALWEAEPTTVMLTIW